MMKFKKYRHHKKIKTANFAIPKIYSILEGKYGRINCFLKFNNPFQLLITAILSAQCTDAKVNAAAPAIFAKYSNAKKMAFANFATLSAIIKPLGLFRNKTKNIIAASKIISKKYHGKIPDTMEGLVLLPGIGRKTANVILGHAFGKPGFPVDTHVQRIIKRLGYTSEKDSPEKIEFFVNKNLLSEYWSEFSLLLITHGRNVCTARNPNCNVCEIRSFCNFQKNNSL
jgi:endonuclease-3